MTHPVLPKVPKIVKEGNSSKLNLRHLDEDGNLLTPTTLKYRIDDLDNHREVLDWTSVSSPASTNTITITAAQNALFSRALKTEQRQVTTKATAASGDIVQEDEYYTLIRIFPREDQLE